jgi:hemin uptake protein HemP
MHKPPVPPPAARDQATSGSRPEPLPPIKSEALFCGAAELQIEHRGSLYRLRQTALGKLILTK